MHNHCFNKLAVTGPLSQLENFERATRGPHEILDLNNFLSMPKEIASAEVPNRDSEQVHRLTRKCGAADWYDWAITYWGTKWGAYGSALAKTTEGALEYWFYTAYDPPRDSFIETTAKRYPDLTLELAYEDQDGAFQGKTVAANGRLTEAWAREITEAWFPDVTDSDGPW